MACLPCICHLLWVTYRHMSTETDGIVMKISGGPDRLTGAQVRMARAALRWSISEAAKQAGIGESTVKAIESADGIAAVGGGLDATREYRASARAEAVNALWHAFERAGIVFVEEPAKSSVGTVVLVEKIGAKGRRA